METEGCPFLDLGTGCRPAAEVSFFTSLLLAFFQFQIEIDNFQARQSRFYFPILIQEMYPAGKGSIGKLRKGDNSFRNKPENQDDDALWGRSDKCLRHFRNV